MFATHKVTWINFESQQLADELQKKLLENLKSIKYIFFFKDNTWDVELADL